MKINPLSVASFANIFSHSEGCLFVLFMVSFAVQKLSSLMRSHLLIFVFVFITLGGGPGLLMLFLFDVLTCSPKDPIQNSDPIGTIVHSKLAHICLTFYVHMNPQGSLLKCRFLMQ